MPLPDVFAGGWDYVLRGETHCVMHLFRL